jgi:acyl-CoA synthetase (AMP-forming)/AMP-acid ligase II
MHTRTEPRYVGARWSRHPAARDHAVVPPDTVLALLDPSRSGPALVDVDGGSIDHAALWERVDRLATRLRSSGLGPGDRIAIVLPNGPEIALVLLAAMSVGCAAPLNPKYREEEFRFYLEDLRAAALVHDGGAPAALAAAPFDSRLVAVRGEGLSIGLDVPARAGPPAASTTGSSTAGTPGADDEALVLHTSGTTSRPKIVPLRQRNLAWSARSIAASLELDRSDRALTVMPLFHIHGIMAGLLAPLSAGGSVVCTPGFDAFRFHRWLDDLAPTYYTAVPTMHQMVLARAPGRRRTSLRFVRSSSASLPGPVLEGLGELFGVPVIESYGMTEASHQMTCNPLPPGIAKPGSVGVATGIELTILDNDNRNLPPGVRGEVAIRGPSVVDGYENNPAANTAAFTAGWFRTGDEGMLDGDGYLYLTGRLKEQINRGGEKISPLEIDEVLLRHPAIAEAVTFAIPHDKLGEEVGAAVVLVEGCIATEAELRTYLRGQLAPFKVPKQILLVAEIPKGATGKVQRIGLAARLDL